jgi:hypothetical protein
MWKECGKGGENMGKSQEAWLADEVFRIALFTAI